MEEATAPAASLKQQEQVRGDDGQHAGREIRKLRRRPRQAKVHQQSISKWITTVARKASRGKHLNQKQNKTKPKNKIKFKKIAPVNFSIYIETFSSWKKKKKGDVGELTQQTRHVLFSLTNVKAPKRRRQWRPSVLFSCTGKPSAARAQTNRHPSRVCNLQAQAARQTSYSSVLRGRSLSPPPSTVDWALTSLRHFPSFLRGNLPPSLPFGAARLPCAFVGGAQVRQGHKVFLEARVGCPQSLPLSLRGEESVLEPHAGGCRLRSQWIANKRPVRMWAGAPQRMPSKQNAQ